MMDEYVVENVALMNLGGYAVGDAEGAVDTPGGNSSIGATATSRNNFAHLMYIRGAS